MLYYFFSIYSTLFKRELPSQPLDYKIFFLFIQNTCEIQFLSFLPSVTKFSSFGQIDPSEKLDPEVEDILMDIADEFVESVSNLTNILSLFFLALKGYP